MAYTAPKPVPTRHTAKQLQLLELARTTGEPQYYRCAGRPRCWWGCDPQGHWAWGNDPADVRYALAGQQAYEDARKGA